MNFAIALIHDDTRAVAAVVRSDTPFNAAFPPFAADDHHIAYLGAFADEAPPVPLWTEWLRSSVSVGTDGAVTIAPGGPTRLDEACTFEAITDASRRGAPVHVQIEAWLRTILPSDDCDAMGLRRSIPISAIKALERVRVARLGMPYASRAAVLERKAQEQSDRQNAANMAALPRGA
jgi:hypothetical protein